MNRFKICLHRLFIKPGVTDRFKNPFFLVVHVTLIMVTIVICHIYCKAKEQQRLQNNHAYEPNSSYILYSITALTTPFRLDRFRIQLTTPSTEDAIIRGTRTWIKPPIWIFFWCIRQCPSTFPVSFLTKIFCQPWWTTSFAHCFVSVLCKLQNRSIMNHYIKVSRKKKRNRLNSNIPINVEA